MSERGDLSVSMTGNKSGFSQMLASAKAEARQAAGEISHGIGESWGGIGKSVLGGFIGAISFEGVKSFIEGIFSSAKGIKEMSEQFDISTDSAQRWTKALDKAGLSQMTFTRALDTLRQKRAEAKEDPSKRGAFEELGLGPAALNGSISDEALLQSILGSGASRVKINDLLGRRGAQLKGALPFLSQVSPTFSEQDIDKLHETELAYKGIGGAVKKFFTKLVLTTQRTLEESQAESIRPGGGDIYRANERLKALFKQRTEEQQRKRDERDAAVAENSLRLEKEAKTEEDNRAKLEATQDRLRVARRAIMSAGDKRGDLQKELREVQDRISGLAPFESILKNSDKIKLNELRTKEAGLKLDLMEKPVLMPHDSLSAIGGFTGSMLNFHPMMQVQQQQLAVLRGIHTALTKGRPVHQP